MRFNLQFLTSMVLIAAASAAPSPEPIVESTSFAPALEGRDVSLLDKRSDFQWRFYDNGGCDHNSNPADTFPENGTPPGQGTIGQCFSAPTGVNWNRVEIDVFFPSGGSLGLQTYCNVNCQGGVSVEQQGTNCYLPISGCAIGSFEVIG